jgi:hypothetical protein
MVTMSVCAHLVKKEISFCRMFSEYIVCGRYQHCAFSFHAAVYCGFPYKTTRITPGFIVNVWLRLSPGRKITRLYSRKQRLDIGLTPTLPTGVRLPKRWHTKLVYVSHAFVHESYVRLRTDSARLRSHGSWLCQEKAYQAIRMIHVAAWLYSVVCPIAFVWNRHPTELCGPTGTEAAEYAVFDRKFDCDARQSQLLTPLG